MLLMMMMTCDCNEKEKNWLYLLIRLTLKMHISVTRDDESIHEYEEYTYKEENCATKISFHFYN